MPHPMPRPARRPIRRALLAALLLAAALPAPRASARAKAEAARGRLPDTVLAVVEDGRPGGTRNEIGRASFLRAWARTSPPSRPDSLTPAGARKFLEVLLDREALARAAARERWSWTAAESAGYATLRDRLEVQASLDSALAETRAALGPAGDTLDAAALGLAARDRAVRRLGLVYDDSLLARLARAFAALPRPTADSTARAQLRMLAALPALDPADTGLAVARSNAGDVRVGELLASWSRLAPVYRPRIEGAAEVRDLAANVLFERLLRRGASGSGRRPDLAARLAEEREFLDVSHLVAREVSARVVIDSLTLLRRYHAHPEEWEQPTRVQLVRLVFDTRAAAAALVVTLSQPASAESLAAHGRRAGARWLVDVGAADDSALFARAMAAGPGAVLGPDKVAGGWAVSRVMAVRPGQPRSFREALPLVQQRWSDEESERLLRALLVRLRAPLRITVNEAALAALGSD